MPSPRTKAPIKTKVLAYLDAHPGADRKAVQEGCGITRQQLDPVLSLGRKKGILEGIGNQWWHHPDGHPAAGKARRNGKLPAVRLVLPPPPDTYIPIPADQPQPLERAIAALEVRIEALRETVELLRRMQ